MTNNKSHITLQIFVKAALPGKVKTRLAKEIGSELAAEFAREQFCYLFELFSKDYEMQYWVEGDSQHFMFDQCDAQSINPQMGCNLGEKMNHSMRQGLLNARKVIVIGSDCSGLNLSIIKEADEALDQHDMVFVPAEDGGFVLWGSKIDHAGIFSNVQWGLENVWTQTLSNLKTLNIDYKALNPSWDIDTLSDIKRHHEALPDVLLNCLLKNSIKLDLSL